MLLSCVYCEQLLGWPKEYVGPVLNIVRLFVLHPHVAETYSKEIVEEKRADEGQTTTFHPATTDYANTLPVC